MGCMAKICSTFVITMGSTLLSISGAMKIRQITIRQMAILPKINSLEWPFSKNLFRQISVFTKNSFCQINNSSN